MQLNVVVLLVALVLCTGSLAQKTHRAPIVPLAKKSQPTTPPKPVEESEHRKECPAGFSFVGKQCAKTVTAPIDISCPRGTVLVDNKCAKYVGKDSECPRGYVAKQGVCVKTTSAAPELVCPPGYALRGKDTCVTSIALPEKTACPPGSTPKGDNCTTSKLETPEYVCPGGYRLVGKKCQREETFDCTPPRVIQEHNEPSKKEVIRPREHTKGKEATVYRLPASQPLVEEYVIKKTCKRIISELARPVCPKGGSFDGKMCHIDVLVNLLVKPGGFEEKVVPALRVCPDGFVEAGPKGECLATEERLPEQFCPPETHDIGNRCAVYTNPKTLCPPGFFLDGKVCTKTIFAAPLVEFTVTYACTGKDCGRHH